MMTELENFHIQPKNINVSKFFLGAFGKMGAEVLANAIVHFCLVRHRWASFTREEIGETCRIVGANPAFLKYLVEGNFLVQEEDRYYLTKQFIEACHKASPAK